MFIQAFDDDLSFLASAYFDAADLTLSPDPTRARAHFDELSTALADPSDIRVYPEQGLNLLNENEIFAISTDICEDLVRRKLGGEFA